jgi:CRP/FNR family transcriptional regulator
VEFGTSYIYRKDTSQKVSTAGEYIASRKKKRPHLNKLIQFSPIFACLSDDELREFKKVIIEKHFRRNETILFEDDTSKFMYFIRSGKVKVVKMLAEGKEHILAIHGKGESFGEMGILDGRTAPATVIALEDSNISLIKKDDFRCHLLKNEKVMQEIILMLCSRLREAWLRLEVLNINKAESRIRESLKLIGLQYGIKEQRGTMITLKLTHKEISEYASLSRETVSRHLKRLVKNDEIEIINRKNILLKPTFFEKTPIW